MSSRDPLDIYTAETDNWFFDDELAQSQDEIEL